LGGAANVARNLASLGATVDLFGVVGNDTWSGVYNKLIAAHNNIIDHSAIDRNRPTTVKSRIVGNQQQIARLDQEVCDPIGKHTQDHLVTILKAIIQECDCVIVSDYAKGVISKELMNQVLLAASWRDIPVLVDPKSADWSIYSGSSLITPNLSEFFSTLKANQLPPLSIESGARQLLGRYQLGAILCTRAQDGMTLITENTHMSIPAHRREVADVSGAGDTVISVMALAFCSGLDWKSATELANIAAGISVSKSGTATVSPEELSAELK
jgi:D-beta-D-heptose 7-phosphate kinase/D-beta-D-heptose 1-phosphate adenosyltransferase